MEKKFLLHSNWKFSLQSNNTEIQDIIKPEQWYDASIPGTIHTDLFNSGIIAEPFYADNELHLQWIDQCDWIYKLNFDLPKDFDKDKPVFLVFEGLDTIADIFLNSSSIASTDNMFRSYRFDITSKLKAKGNSLEVLFTSPVKYARRLEEKHGRLPVALRSERVYIRKAQYSFGWDWGPCFITSGIWRSVYLMQRTDTSIEKISFETIQASGNEAVSKVVIGLNQKPSKGCKLKVSLTDTVQATEKVLATFDSATAKVKINIKNPKLWWPNNYGTPYLYTLTVQLLDQDNEVIDEKVRKVGLRTIKLILEEKGKPRFRFHVNNTPVFAMGANWIPSDSFLPRVKESEYRELLDLAQKANMNMVRVWGGGVYESDVFYEICDELGLMVWQDFMFACASYPEHEEFIKNVKHEAEENIERLQYHPSIAIWCGNNENEWIWYQEQKRPVKEMSGFKIYHDILPKIVKKLDPERAYWPSTPYSEEEDPNSPNSGNRHQWDLWSRWVDYKSVKGDKSLFVTEFGFQGPANYDTIKKVIPKKERQPQSRLFEFHNKQVEGPERLYKFLVSHLPVSNDIKDFIYLTQLSQAFALKECLEHWLMRYNQTNGAIIWQLNDCWPVTSWSVIDSEGIPKLSYYFVREAFKSQIAGFEKKGKNIEVNILNNSPKVFSGNIQIQFIHLPKGKIEDIKFLEAEIQPLCKQTIFTLPAMSSLSSGETIILSTLRDHEKNIIHRNYYLEAEWKHISLPKVNLDARSNYTDHITVTADKPVFFAGLYSEDIIFSRNGFIILPDEEILIKSRRISPGNE
ncbi:MAG: glycoside hydrolase family 2 protein, partial [Bacillota bacterium]